jgi:glycosyltransferase involved in cell wall biosynthesis
MRVVHLGLSHRIDDIRIVKKECRSISEAGFDVFYLTSDRHGKNINKTINGNKIMTVENTTNLYSPKKNFLKFIKQMKMINFNIYKAAIKLDADIYHIHEGGLLSVGKKLKMQGKIVIYDSHEDIPRQQYTYFTDRYNHFIGKVYEIIFEAYENRIVKSFDYVITATNHIRKRLEKINSNIAVVNNYPLLDDIICDNEDFETRKNLLCFAGGIEDSNGIKNILKAIKKVNGKFLVAGLLSKSDKCKYEKMAGWEKTNYIGFLNRAEISELYNKCVAGIVTDMPTGNNIEGLPIKMFEFMIAGLPVITSDFPLRKEIILENQCGICVNPASPNEIAEAINYIFENKGRAKKMGINGRKAVIRKYNWDTQ